eukprot:TRINITY_DN50439_c0_g1_i1.p1 TRINITY_DN50439_c0_g1~~TRINITY_DN50439_c0_g1_i1.p1  ORF type:complete len:594 (+),score=113.63 TRINITY_DN50439_c0_g1_i1:83-1864(+)
MEYNTDADLPHVNLVFIGPCACGKSTIMGHLVADSGAIDQENLQRIADEAHARGQPDRCYAWILDKLKCERERGNTMFAASWRLASKRCRFTMIDAPGHPDFSKDIVTAMSQADVAVLVVPAVQDDLEQGKECEGQIREHTMLAYTLGLRQLVVCVNKMDSDAVAYSEECFDSACKVVREDLAAAGLKTHDVYFDVHFVPTSGWLGDNVTDRSENMPWYCGPTLVEALDDAVASHFKPERPLRFPLREVMKVGGKGTVVVGRVEGSLKCGTQLVFAPGGTCTQVTSLTMHHESLKEAFTGSIVNAVVDADTSELRSGMVGASADEHPAYECSSFLAQVIVLNDPRAGEITAGCVLSVAVHTAQVLCTFEELLSRTDRRTGKVLEMMPPALHVGDAAVVRLRPQTPLCVEAFEEHPALGRFSVHDQKITVALGVVQEVQHAPGQTILAKVPKSSKPVTPSRSSKAAKLKLGSERIKPKEAACSDAIRDRAAPGHRLRTFSADSGEDAEVASPIVRPSDVFGSGGYTAAPKMAAATAPWSSSSPFAAFGAVATKEKASKKDGQLPYTIPATRGGTGTSGCRNNSSGSGGSDGTSP